MDIEKYEHNMWTSKMWTYMVWIENQPMKEEEKRK